MRGIDGVPADADRHEGFTEVAEGLSRHQGDRRSSPAGRSTRPRRRPRTCSASGKPIDGIWTSGIDSTVVDAYKTAGKPFVPVVGADNNGFVGQLIDLKAKGFTGAAVTNPPSVGGAGLAVALDVLQKKDHPHVIKITAAVWDNDNGPCADAQEASTMPSSIPSTASPMTCALYVTSRWSRSSPARAPEPESIGTLEASASAGGRRRRPLFWTRTHERTSALLDIHGIAKSFGAVGRCARPTSKCARAKSMR